MYSCMYFDDILIEKVRFVELYVYFCMFFYIYIYMYNRKIKRMKICLLFIRN